MSSKGKRRAETGGGDTDDETNDGSASGGGAVGPDTAFTGEGASYLSALLGTSGTNGRTAVACEGEEVRLPLLLPSRSPS